MSSKNKIKLVHIIADSDLGGGPRHILGLLKNIDKSVFDCYLICPAGDLARQARDIPNVKVTDQEMRSKFDLVAFLRLQKLLSGIQASYDPFGPMIVHTHGPRAGILGRLATPKGAFSVYTEHIWTTDYHLESWINEWLQLSILKVLNSKTNIIIAVSQAVKNLLVNKMRLPENQIKIIPNAIDFEAFKIHEKSPAHHNHFVIGTVGSLNHQKGQIYLVEAMAEIIKKYPHALCEIIGEGDEREHLQAKIDELALSRHITLLGRINEPYRQMSKWSVFVLPSLTETFGIVILEAFSLKIPVIATNTGGIPDLIKDKKNGLLINPESSNQIAQKVIELHEHPALREQMIREGHKTLNKYSWDHIIKQIEATYETMIGKR